MNATTLAIATQLATAHPESALPCPACAASVSGKNLPSHLAKVHPELEALDAPRVLVGTDGRFLIVAAIPFVVAAVALGAGVVLAELPEAVAGGMLGGLVLAYLGLVGLHALGVFRARLELDRDEVRLRYALGLLTTRIALPASVETGPRVVARTASSETDLSFQDRVRAGVYLRLGERVTIVTPKGTGLRSHWSGWRQGSARGHYDITIDGPAMIALEYHLARHGALSPR